MTTSHMLRQMGRSAASVDLLITGAGAGQANKSVASLARNRAASPQACRRGTSPPQSSAHEATLASAASLLPLSRDGFGDGGIRVMTWSTGLSGNAIVGSQRLPSPAGLPFQTQPPRSLQAALHLDVARDASEQVEASQTGVENAAVREPTPAVSCSQDVPPYHHSQLSDVPVHVGATGFGSSGSSVLASPGAACGSGAAISAPLSSNRKHILRNLDLRSPLAPSTTPTPRHGATVSGEMWHAQSSQTLHVDRKQFQLRGGQILAPSHGASNDAARVRNCGRRLNATPLQNILVKSVSEPSIVKSFERETSLPSVEAKTPRTLRGTVRRTSKVNLFYAPAVAKQKRTVVKSLQQELGADNESAGHRRSPAHKRVSFADDVPTGSTDFSVNTRSESDMRGVALERSMKLMDSLYDLRRCGVKPASVEQPTDDALAASDAADQHSAADPQFSGAGVKEEPQDPLMVATLKELADTEEQIRKTETLLQFAQDPVSEYGGSRHATAVISARTLAVVRRKANLLRAAEARIATFLEAQARQEQIVEHVKSDPQATPPPELCGVKKFLSAHVHKDGNPADADKSNFDIFATSFGLPKEHQSVVRLKTLMNEATDWWAYETLRQAQDGADSDMIQRFMAFVIAISGDDRHPVLAEVNAILANRLAEKVLANAERLQDRDAGCVARSSAAQPESARDCAEAILEDIKMAKAMGASPKHPAMEKAKGIEARLRIAISDRLALRVLQGAQSLQAKDEKAAARHAPNVPPVGPASEMGDVIEKDVNDVSEKHKVPLTHAHLVDAMKIAKALRDEDGQRKRLAAREKRLAKAQQ